MGSSGISWEMSFTIFETSPVFLLGLKKMVSDVILHWACFFSNF